jgi:hypothetical protein
MPADFKYKINMDKPGVVEWLYETKWEAEKLVAFLREGEQKGYIQPSPLETEKETRLKAENAKLEREVRKLLSEINRRDAVAKGILEAIQTLNTSLSHLNGHGSAAGHAGRSGEPKQNTSIACNV